MSYAEQQDAILSGQKTGSEPPRRMRANLRESADQQAVIAWARGSENAYPCLRLLHAIPNGGQRGNRVQAVVTGRRMKSEGVKRGIPDLQLPVAAFEYHSLYIEMKSSDGRLSDEQIEVIEQLRRYGNHVVVCKSADDAIRVIEDYARGVSERAAD